MWLDSHAETVVRARRRGILTRQLNVNGVLRSRASYIEESLSGGAKVGESPEGRALVFPDGRYMREAQISKVALDYAEWLAGKPL